MVKKNEDCDKQETKIKERFIVGMWKNPNISLIFKIYGTFFFIWFSVPIVFLFIAIFETIFKLIFKKK